MKTQPTDKRQNDPKSLESAANWKQAPVNICKGVVIGVGAILPDISGGNCALWFGIYKPMMTYASP